MAPCDILKQALRAAGATSVTVSLNQFGDLKKRQIRQRRHVTGNKQMARKANRNAKVKTITAQLH